jgi:hypothetical protein
MDRRRFLSGTGFALVATFAGCLSAIDSNGTAQETEDLPVRFWLKEESLSASEQESVNPIVFGELSTDEQEIVQAALEEGEYTVEQGSEPPALEHLRDRIEQKTGNGETLEAYLEREDTYYRIGFVDGDHIIAHPDH